MLRRLPLLLVAAIALGLVLLHGLAPARPTSHASFGRGAPIVMVHGLGSARAHWLPVARLLARGHRVTLVDLPGHGVSAMPRPFSLDQATEALDRALAERGSEPVVLVGHSLGGLVCAAEALAHPGRVKALVLVETALRPQVPGTERAMLQRALDRHYDEFVRAAYVDFGRDSAQGEALWREVAALDRDMVRRWIRLAFTADLSAAVARLRVPVLVVVAPRSWTAAESWPDVARALGYARVPRVRAVRLDGAGHFVMLDRPRELASLIAGFAAHPVTDERLAAR